MKKLFVLAAGMISAVCLLLAAVSSPLYVGSFSGNASGLTNLNGSAFSPLAPVPSVDLTGPITISVNPPRPSTPVNAGVFLPPQYFGGHGEVQIIGDVFEYNLGSIAAASVLFDGDVTTYISGSLGAAAGLHTTNYAVLTRVRLAPEPSGVAGNPKENYMNTMQVSTCTDESFSSPTNYLTIPAQMSSQANYPWYPRFQMQEFPISMTTSNKFFYVNAPANYFALSEIQFIGIGTTNAKPVAPVISPWGGRFTNGYAVVTLSSISTAAQIYYTTNGSSPTTNSTLYAGPFVLPCSAFPGVSLKAIAYDAGLYQPYSSVSSNAWFESSGFVPLDNIRDSMGTLVEGHGGCLLNDWQNGNGFLWYGDFCNYAEAAPTLAQSIGTWCYQSSDLLNWTNLGQVSGMPPANWIYHYRPKVLWNAAYRMYVKWEELATGTASLFGVSTSSAPNGPFTFVSTNASPYGGGVLGDFSLMIDTNGTAYLTCATNPPTGGVWVKQLDATFTNWTAAAAVPVVATYREGVAMFRHTNGVCFCVTSAGNYYDSTTTFGLNYYYSTNGPMGTWYPGGNLSTNSLLSTAYSPANGFNGQSAWVFQSPWNVGQYILGCDFWYNGSTPLWDIYTGAYDTNNAPFAPVGGYGANGTLYDARQVWLPLTLTSSTNLTVVTNANWWTTEWNKLFSVPAVAVNGVSNLATPLSIGNSSGGVTVDAAGNVVATGTITAKAIAGSAWSAITNGPAVWLTTNNVPSGAWPEGSIATRTDATGGIYLFHSGSWVAH